jgi:hypothetical protein
VGRQRQVNIRLNDSDFEALEAAAFIRRRSLPDELRAAVLDHLTTSEEDPRVGEAKRLRDEPYDASDSTGGVISSLDEKRRGGR